MRKKIGAGERNWRGFREGILECLNITDAKETQIRPNKQRFSPQGRFLLLLIDGSIVLSILYLHHETPSVQGHRQVIIRGATMTKTTKNTCIFTQILGVISSRFLRQDHVIPVLLDLFSVYRSVCLFLSFPFSWPAWLSDEGNSNGVILAFSRVHISSFLAHIAAMILIEESWSISKVCSNDEVCVCSLFIHVCFSIHFPGLDVVLLWQTWAVTMLAMDKDNQNNVAVKM